MCRIDEGSLLGKRTASGGASSSSTQQPDELMATFLPTHPFLAPMRDSFAHSILMCIFLSVLHLNGVPGYVFGGFFVFDRRFEGIDVLRFFCVLKTITSASVTNALRGGRVSREARSKKHKGVYDLRLRNLTCVPSVRQLQRATGTPFRIEDVITMPNEAPAVNRTADMFERSELLAPFCGVTFDCAYGESRAEVLQEIESKKYVCVGGATAAELVGAALRADDVTGRKALEGDSTVATQLMAMVLHDFDGKHAALVAVIPLNDETGEKSEGQP